MGGAVHEPPQRKDGGGCRLARTALSPHFPAIRELNREIYQLSQCPPANMAGRDGLNQLMADVEAKRTTFTSLLVYDVSRWGRFQDVDESAYYEYVLNRAGIRVHYCAEQFENDGDYLLIGAQTLKRSMAAEYSRELSVKVFSGQCRLIELGFQDRPRQSHAAMSINSTFGLISAELYRRYSWNMRVGWAQFECGLCGLIHWRLACTVESLH